MSRHAQPLPDEPLARPYLLTGGRTFDPGGAALETVVLATGEPWPLVIASTG